MSANGLATIPGRLWEKLPPSVSHVDAAIREALLPLINHAQPFWAALSFLSESAPGLIVFYCTLLISAALLWTQHYRSKNLIRPSVFRFLASAGLLAFLLALCDGVNHLLKLAFGRLKPSVAIYVGGVAQPLSFPSGHSMNTAFLCVLCVAAAQPLPATQRRVVHVLAFLLTFAIGLSRVVLGRHFPFDVIAGWFIGALLALLVSRFYLRASSRLMSTTLKRGMP